MIYYFRLSVVLFHMLSISSISSSANVILKIDAMSELLQHNIHVGTCGFSHLLVGCDTCVRMASRAYVGCTCAYSFGSSGPFSSAGKVDDNGPMES